jgi:hypothetical protein
MNSNDSNLLAFMAIQPCVSVCCWILGEKISLLAGKIFLCNLRGAIDRQNAFAEGLIDGYEPSFKRVGRRLQSHANPPSASLSRKRNLRLFKGGLNEHR